ncbi:MAG: hypothetical protein M3Y85_13150 [Bacteroidota bacterium]|nr:hypothetical protein [Bacteroidota bacterium]
MTTPQKNNNDKPTVIKSTLADTGNASNPSPHNHVNESSDANQLLGKGAEKYLRESGNIEDLPDAQDEENMDEVIEKEKEES